ncbi:MAG: sensor histidine kinase [Oscillibacter sp.]|nr:sensor histidine kinase [Oscillibacter sp.]
MSMETYLTDLFCSGVFIPAALMCCLPMRNQFRCGVKKVLMGTGLALCVSIPLLTLLDTAYSMKYNVLLAPVALVCLLAFHATLKTPFYQTLAVFVLVCAILSFNSNFANAFDAFRHPTATIEEKSLEAGVFQFALSVAFAATLSWPLAHYGSWLIDHFRIRRVWNISTAVSVVFLAFNVLTVPKQYETLHVNNMGKVFFTVVPLMLILLFLLCWVFYSIVRGMVDMAEVQERNRILEMEESQYRKLQAYMKESAAFRHDFRHVIGTLDELLSAGDAENAAKYLKEYIVSMPKNETTIYCNHPALNATLNYYAESARPSRVRLRIAVELPEKLPISDVEVCSIVGNLFDNAINACREIPEAERWIDMTISCPNAVRFGIVASNSFSGKVKTDGDRYLSMRPGGSGIGLTSVTSIAERYNGTATFRHEGNVFFSGVIIPMRRE